MELQRRRKDVINHLWDTQRIKEEMSYAFANMKMKSPTRFFDPQLNQVFDKTESYFKANWTDGTPLEIIMTNYHIDPVGQTLKYDHIRNIFLKTE